MIKRILPYILSIALALAVGGLSALISGSTSIYEEINRPFLSPPGWLFPVVWTVLYVLMGISAALVYQKREEAPEAARRGLLYYGVSLLLNFAFSPIFFRLKAFLLAFFVIVALFIFVLLTVESYKKVSKTAAYLQIPYLIWLGFAAYLSASIALIN